MNRIISIASVSAAFAVVMGAWTAHGLKQQVTESELEILKTALQYQWYHTFALFITGILIKLYPEIRGLHLVAYLFLSGIFLFSGALYLLVFTHTSLIGSISPVGGAIWIVAWLQLSRIFFQQLRREEKPDKDSE